MPNISPVDPARPGPAADIVQAVRARMNGIPNIFATMARSPAVLEGFLAFTGALDGGLLPPALREQIALAVAGSNECDYCASAHTFVARGAGVDRTEAALNLKGSATDPRTNAVLTFARAVVSSRARLPENASSLNELRNSGVSDPEIGLPMPTGRRSRTRVRGPSSHDR
jgi:AhpD family alkylhydroperoxidase